MTGLPTEVVVVIVTYKTAELTIDCLRSIEPERSTPGLKIRAIVVDNDSGDAGTVQAAISDMNWSEWATVLVAPKNGGFGYGNNFGFKHACETGDPAFFHMLNPDTVVRPGAIGELVHFLQAHAGAGIAGSSFENQDGSEWPFAFRFPTLLSEIESGLEFGLVSRMLRKHQVARHMSSVAERVDWVSGASMMLRRKTLETIGGLDEGYFLYFEETDYSFRAAQAGIETWHVPASKVMHIAGQSTKLTERHAAKKRLPAYWFESRRRFFWMNYGRGYAASVDLVTFAAVWLGGVKRFLQRRSDGATPRFLRDLFVHRAFVNGAAEHATSKRFVPRF